MEGRHRTGDADRRLELRRRKAAMLIVGTLIIATVDKFALMPWRGAKPNAWQ